jgi:enoyl-CoA hydratase/carnithine racemase
MKTIHVSTLDEGTILVLSINRPKKRNAMNYDFWNEFPQCFPSAADVGLIRAVVVCGEGQAFSAGLDTSDERIAGVASSGGHGLDVARTALSVRSQILWMQASLSASERCPVPVIAAVHGACIGAGVDLITACDVRLCSSDALFSIREVRLGLAADVGTLQRLPKIVANESVVRELAFTGSDFDASAARDMGLVSRVVQGGKEGVFNEAVALARKIAALSPVAVAGTKANLLYSRDHPNVSDGLEYQATWNASALQSDDVKVAAIAKVTKEAPLFSKL